MVQSHNRIHEYIHTYMCTHINRIDLFIELCNSKVLQKYDLRISVEIKTACKPLPYFLLLFALFLHRPSSISPLSLFLLCLESVLHLSLTLSQLCFHLVGALSWHNVSSLLILLSGLRHLCLRSVLALFCFCPGVRPLQITPSKLSLHPHPPPELSPALPS